MLNLMRNRSDNQLLGISSINTHQNRKVSPEVNKHHPKSRIFWDLEACNPVYFDDAQASYNLDNPDEQLTSMQ